MNPIHLPPDFDRLPEFRMLCAELQRTALGFAEDMARVEELAIVIWIRLWCALAYQTSSGELPGYIRADGLGLCVYQFRATTPLEADEIIKVLVAARVLELGPSSGMLEYFSPVFARNNKHLDPRSERRELRGNRHSGISKGLSQAQRQAQEQMLLLAGEACQRADGTAMAPEEKVAAMTVVKCIDNVLNRRHREMWDYSPGLMADALEFSQRFSTDSMRKEFYFWLSDCLETEQSEVPKTAEQILANLPALVALRRKEQMEKAVAT